MVWEESFTEGVWLGREGREGLLTQWTGVRELPDHVQGSGGRRLVHIAVMICQCTVVEQRLNFKDSMSVTLLHTPLRFLQAPLECY